MPKLSERDRESAYNACIAMRNTARGEAHAAVEDFNRATAAAEALYRLRLESYKLTPQHTR